MSLALHPRIPVLGAAIGLAFLTAALRLGPLFDPGVGASRWWNNFDNVGTVALIDRWDGRADAKLALGKRLIASSAYNATAAVWLANESESNGDTGTSLAIADALDRIGWRDPQSQRLLYNRQYDMPDYPAALRHADALLRQNYAQAELFAHFDAEIAKPAFRVALARQLAGPSPWHTTYLAHAIAEAPIEPAALLYSEFRAGVSPEERGTKDGLAFRGFLKRGANEEAALIGRRMGGEGLPSFDAADRNSAPVPGRWRLPAGFTAITANGETRLTASGGARNREVTTLLTLKPGRYRVSGTGLGVDRGWSWSITCRSNRRLPINRLGEMITITAECPVQGFAIRARDPDRVGIPAPRIQPS